MNNDNTIDNFEETFEQDFLNSKPIYTHFSIDIAPEDKCIFNSCASTKAQLKQMGQTWSDALFKHVYAVSHKAQVESLLQAKQLAFSTVLELNPFTNKTKQQIGADSQMNFLVKEIIDEDQKLAIICEQLKVYEDELAIKPLETDPYFALRSDGYELYHSIQQKRTQKEALIKKMDGISNVEVGKSSGVKKRLHNKKSFKEIRHAPKKQWLIDEILGVKDMAMIYSSPGCGKTFIALDLIGSAITGRKWADKFSIARPLNVAYCTGEGLQGITERIDALGVKYNINDEITNFSFYDQTPQLFDMAIPVNSNSFIDEWLEDIKQGTESPLDMIVIDTFHNATRGLKENATDDTGIVINNCNVISEKLGCAVVLVHHSTKDGASERGSTTIRGAMDIMIEVKNGSIHCSKVKYGRGWSPVGFNLVEIAGTDSACVEWTKYVPPTSSESKKEDKNWLVNVLKFFNENKGKFYTAHQISDELGWSYSFWVKVLKQGLQEGEYSSSASDPSKAVHSKNPQTYGIK
jgi:hypothetical protein